MIAVYLAGFELPDFGLPSGAPQAPAAATPAGVSAAADRIAGLESAAARASEAVRRLLLGLRPGMTETTAARLAEADGLVPPGSVAVASGPRVLAGLGGAAGGGVAAAVPTDKVIERGEPLIAACAVGGAVCRRAGIVAESEAALPASIRDYVDRLVTPCYAALVECWETVGLDVPGGALRQIVERRLGNPFFGIAGDPLTIVGGDGGAAPPAVTDGEPLASGTVLRIAVVPAAEGYGTSIAEDTIALAGEALRADLAERYPQAWERIRLRRAFLREVLGIGIRPEVLPLGALPGWLPPFLLDPRRAMTVFRLCERGH